jgi:fatty-acyl-CoA synthase
MTAIGYWQRWAKPSVNEQIPGENMASKQLSYAHGASEAPLIYQTIGARFDEAAARWSDREAVVVCDQGVRLTFAELKREVDRLATGLLALGLRAGDRIGLWSPNNIAWILTQYATAKAGLILVNINPAYRVAELEYALNKVECRALITADRFKSSDYLGMLRELAPGIDTSAPGQLAAERLPHLRTLIHIGDADEPGYLSFDEVQRLGGPAEYERLAEVGETLQPDDPINIQFTSGTTGSPKAATLTHHNSLSNAISQGLGAGIVEGDRYCVPVPLYHAAGMVCGSPAWSRVQPWFIRARASTHWPHCKHFRTSSAQQS